MTRTMTTHQVKILFLIICCCFVISFYPATGFSKEKPLPPACTSQCVTPFGKVLGVGLGNVPAYSNCNDKCVYLSPNTQAGSYTGIKWQCVEYARRWLLVNKGVVYGDVDIAADIWGLNYVTRVKDKAKLKMTTYTNGDVTLPELGDLLIYAKAYLKTGHVAVIVSVDQNAHTIDVAEENFKNTKWPDGYARRIPYVVHDGKFWLLDGYLLGWKHVTKQLVSTAQ
jgi:hypothetical protein